MYIDINNNQRAVQASSKKKFTVPYDSCTGKVKGSNVKARHAEETMTGVVHASLVIQNQLTSQNTLQSYVQDRTHKYRYIKLYRNASGPIYSLMRVSCQSGERWLTSWTGCQSITGPRIQAHKPVILIAMDNLESPYPQVLGQFYLYSASS